MKAENLHLAYEFCQFATRQILLTISYQAVTNQDKITQQIVCLVIEIATFFTLVPFVYSQYSAQAFPHEGKFPSVWFLCSLLAKFAIIVLQIEGVIGN